MRKRNFNYILDKVFWTLVEWLPLILLFFALVFSQVQYKTALDKGDIIYGDELYVDVLVNNIDSVNNIIPVNNSLSTSFTEFLTTYVYDSYEIDVLITFLVKFLMWYIETLIIHVCFDALAFVPRFAHKYLEKVEE